MPTIHITDDSGQLTVTVDDGQPQPVQSAEEACAIVESTFGQPAEDAEGAMEAGFQQVRGGGLNA